MTQEERDLISRFVARVGGATQNGGFISGSGGSVPQQQAPLPPIDREADQFIADQFQQHPEARYRITQMAVVQEAALTEMNNRLQRMQWELGQARQQQQAPAKSGGLFGSLFGGGSQQQRPQQGGQQGPWGAAGSYGQQQYAPPPPQYPPQYQPGMFNRGGSGFLGSALTTAAGVAGGMVAGNALMNMFSGNHGEAAAGGLGGGFLGGGGADAGTNAFDGAGVDPGQDFTGGFGNDQGGGGFDQGGGGFDQGGGGFDQAGGGFDGGGGGGFDGGGGGGFDNT